MGSGVGKARLVAMRPLTYDTNEYTFEMVEPSEIQFRAGQFVSIRCGEEADGTVQMRSYSIASSSSVQDRLVLVVKLVPGGLASRFFTVLKNGSEIEFTGPMGFFVLELSHPGDVVIGATGTGLAPVIPMLEELSGRSETGRIQLYFGCRKREDAFYLDRLDELAGRMPRFQWQLCLTQPAPDWTGCKTRITPLLVNAATKFAKPTFYLVGNGQMIDEAKALLQQRGVDRKRQIRTEAFFK